MRVYVRTRNIYVHTCNMYVRMYIWAATVSKLQETLEESRRENRALSEWKGKLDEQMQALVDEQMQALELELSQVLIAKNKNKKHTTHIQGAIIITQFTTHIHYTRIARAIDYTHIQRTNAPS